MANYAVIENGTVVNTILADSKEIAEEVTKKECIESTEENQIAIGWYWSAEHNKYIMPSPFPSWVFDGENWNAPTPRPEDADKIYVWNEDTTSWVELTIPEIAPQGE